MCVCFFFEHVLLLPHASYSPTYIVRVGCRLDVMPVICVFVSFLLDDYCGVDDTDVNRFCSSILVSDKCLDTGRCGRFPAAVTPPKCVFSLWLRMRTAAAAMVGRRLIF